MACLNLMMPRLVALRSPTLSFAPVESLLHRTTSIAPWKSRAIRCAVLQKVENEFSLLDSEVTELGEEVIHNLDSKKDLPFNLGEMRSKPPLNLSVKEKKELSSYAHSLGKKLKSQQIGKSGVTENVAMALNETLEANELLKLKIHNSCPGELDDAIKQLEETTGSVVVGQIGRTVILYKPSLVKLKEEEKKKQMAKLYLKRQSISRNRRTNSSPRSGQEQGQYGVGRRGSSRFRAS